MLRRHRTIVPTGVVVLLVTAWLCGPATAAKVSFTTGPEFATGTFDQTVLTGTEFAPQILLGSQSVFNWTWEDDDITGWLYGANEAGNVAEENPSGQIHLRADWQSATSGSYAFARQMSVPVPNQCSLEFRVWFDSLEASGVVDPMVDQPTGACGRFDVLLTSLGLRLDVFSDRIVAFYFVGPSGIDYPSLGYIDVPTATGRWYDLRFDVDFNAPGLPVQIYQDDVWVGELPADTRNAFSSGPMIRTMAFSRGSASGVAEMHVDRARLGTQTSVPHMNGTYTSQTMEVNATALLDFHWTEVAAWPQPWGNWVKNPGNPILPATSLVENMLASVDDPLQQPLLYDGKYWLCYASGGPGQTIRLAYSTDPGLMTWTDYESNPVLSAGVGESYVFSPHLFINDGTYYLFYDVALASDGRQRIAFATAPAPTGPWAKQQIVLDRGGTGQWDEYRVCEPFVFKDGTTYYLYYGGGLVEQVGLATTDEAHFPLGPEPGGEWTKQGLILPGSGDPADWDSDWAANPSLVKVDDTYYMRYSGSPASGAFQLGTAWAADPAGPWQRPPVAEITLGAAGAFDDEKALRGALHYHDGQWFSPYTGGSEPGWPGYSSGMASAAPATVTDELIFATRTSPDGGTWEEWRAATNGSSILSTPDTYMQFRASFTGSGDGLSPILTSVWFFQEGDPVAAFLASYSVIAQGDAAVISWRVNGSVEPGAFRVVGRNQDEQWIVPIESPREGFYTARDESMIDRTAGEIVYDLLYYSPGQGWRLLDSRTVMPGNTPLVSRLWEPYPNPFNPQTIVSFTLDRSQPVELIVFDLSGRKVAGLAAGVFPAGRHEVVWTGQDGAGRDVSSGLYFVRMKAKDLLEVQRMVLVR